MGAVVAGFASMSDAQWKALVDTRARAAFQSSRRHAGGRWQRARISSHRNFSARRKRNALRQSEGHHRRSGVFRAERAAWTGCFPSAAIAPKWFTYALSRLAAYDVTWQGIEALGELRQRTRPAEGDRRISQPRSIPTSTRAPRAPIPHPAALVDDGWLRYRSYQTGDDADRRHRTADLSVPRREQFRAGEPDGRGYVPSPPVECDHEWPVPFDGDSQRAGRERNEDLVRIHGGHAALGTGAVLRCG